MASEIYYRGTFSAEMLNSYGKERWTNSRMQSVWNSVKSFSDEALAIALKEVTKPTMFIGADKVIEICAGINAKIKEEQIAKVKANENCSFCSNGLRQVNGHAYRCSCKLGELAYPNIPLYDGQAHWADKYYRDEEGNEVTETKTHIYRIKPGSKSIKDCSFTLKGPIYSKPKDELNKPRLIKAEHFNAESF